MTDDDLLELLQLTRTSSKFLDAIWSNSRGELHRIHGPAVEHANGSQEWFRNGLRHRDRGPAVEWTNGRKEWWENGQLHRIDGPAISYSNGLQEWWENGTRIK
jgi:hypothetical protein